jgi:deazaflavin-dependent oxidoreductase (nitroreductase family)
MSENNSVIMNFVFKVFHLFVLGEKGDLEAPSRRNRKYTPSQERRLKFSRQLITKANICLLWISRGRMGNSFLGRPVVLLTTIGRKTGKPRTQPVFFMRDGERVVLVASNGGSPDDPAWLLNAQANPVVSIAERGKAQKMTLRIAGAEEEAQLWPKLLKVFPGWQDGNECCRRKISVVVLEPCK